MRICTNCEELTDNKTCPKCHKPTEDIDIKSDTEQLFEFQDVDKARSILTKLKKDYADAHDDVLKAERKVRHARVDLDYAGKTLMNFWELITTPQDEPIEFSQLMLPATTASYEVDEETGEIEEVD